MCLCVCGGRAAGGGGEAVQSPAWWSTLPAPSRCTPCTVSPTYSAQGRAQCGTPSAARPQLGGAGVAGGRRRAAVRVVGNVGTRLGIGGLWSQQNVTLARGVQEEGDAVRAENVEREGQGRGGSSFETTVLQPRACKVVEPALQCSVDENKRHGGAARCPLRMRDRPWRLRAD